MCSTRTCYFKFAEMILEPLVNSTNSFSPKFLISYLTIVSIQIW